LSNFSKFQLENGKRGSKEKEENECIECSEFAGFGRAGNHFGWVWLVGGISGVYISGLGMWRVPLGFSDLRYACEGIQKRKAGNQGHLVVQLLEELGIEKKVRMLGVTFYFRGGNGI
jgi:hypothetical protein